MNDKNSEIVKQIETINSLLETTEKNIQKIKSMLQMLESDSKKDMYRDVPGVTGVFNGISMTAEDGKTYDVPANYAAKSRLVYGDTLKLIDEGEKKVFKQIEKVERRKIEGILTKKEGRWYILSDAGSYKISDNAAEFNGAQLNDEAVAFIPANNLGVTFASLDSLKKNDHGNGDNFHPRAPQKERDFTPTPKPQSQSPSHAQPQTQHAQTPVQAKEPSKTTPVQPKPENKPAPKPVASRPAPAKKSYSKSAPSPVSRPAPAKPKAKREFVENIISLDEDKSGDISLQSKTSKALDEDDLR
ncbi:hypothetical protein A2415_03750 [candidate division WWE3 bacterium RIFOXYC1_FULL_39_7]|uniref:50S ribosomal protein L7/L12 n=2 Tax=Katanobacteria TaxID=422282 RepID=A0A1F4X3E1_UNCKA|nr:MAG: hypothetical protein A2415_03750 [candidate division WWE3 bacterium RIFOXYC1_FULL_39_7]OGC76197.1 MAG: hypothetical protein A2619_01260 [candidate division WWE3 bacterium RIFOXYD1_FULL_39_9]